MGEQQTQLSVLIIVALVGLAAITAMGLHASDYSPQTTTSSSSESIVGAATSPSNEASAEPAKLPAYSRMDYNADGVLDQRDSEILSEVITLGSCPPARVCDVDGNGRLDVRDLERFNGLLSEPIQPDQKPSGSAQQAPAVSGNTVDSQEVVRKPLPDLYDGEYPSAAILA